MRLSAVSESARRRAGKNTLQAAVTAMLAAPPADDGAHGSPPVRGQSAFELAKFVRRTKK